MMVNSSSGPSGGGSQECCDTLNWREFACGWSAAFINITFTYPIYKIIFRQMLDGISITTAFQQLHNEGIYFLYRGMMPPLIQKTISLSLMFGIYDEVKRPLLNNDVNPYVAKSIGGLVAGSMEAILAPFERIQTLLATSAYHRNFRNTLHAFKVVGLKFGVREYYRGLGPILLRNGPSNALFFIAREEVQLRQTKDRSWLQSNMDDFVTGALIGACLSSFFYPLNVLKVAMQSHLGGPFQGMGAVFMQVYNERGRKIRYMYLGVEANCFRAFISWGVMNAAYENMKKIFY